MLGWPEAKKPGEMDKKGSNVALKVSWPMTTKKNGVYPCDRKVTARDKNLLPYFASGNNRLTKRCSVAILKKAFHSIKCQLTNNKCTAVERHGFSCLDFSQDWLKVPL